MASSSSFRRAHLRGSEELFRPTQGTGSGVAAAAASPTEEPPTARAEGRLLRLTDDEITQLADALHRLKFPPPVPTKPSIAEREQLEDLRQKLLAAL
ncbi:MAG TPA: hypothetical protein VH134_16025 [Candidatus Dormibacteraeota bacterium]|jgi:hypothetical protein|nr:hypothetical protein [Candidatus Dormibacteraeota bacterium]